MITSLYIISYKRHFNLIKNKSLKAILVNSILGKGNSIMANAAKSGPR